MPYELPNPPVDCSDLISKIKTNLESLAIHQNKQRLRAFKDKVSAKDGNTYSSWQYLPIARLESLNRQLIKEIEAIASPVVAKPVEEPKVESKFF